MNKIDSINKKEFAMECFDLINNVKRTVADLNEKYAKVLKRDIEQIIRFEIDNFYEDYEPNSYDRYGSLYDVYKVEINTKTHKMEIDIDSQYMKDIVNKNRRLSNEGIFNIALEKGWHGGAIPKDQNARTIYGNQVIPNTPYWRRGFSARYWRYTHWYKPAQIMDGEPPIDRIEKRISDYMDIKNKEFNKELHQIEEKMNKKFSRLLTGLYRYLAEKRKEQMEE